MANGFASAFWSRKYQCKLQICVCISQVSLNLPLVDTAHLLETRGLQQTLVVSTVPMAPSLAYF